LESGKQGSPASKQKKEPKRKKRGCKNGTGDCPTVDPQATERCGGVFRNASTCLFAKIEPAKKGKVPKKPPQLGTTTGDATSPRGVRVSIPQEGTPNKDPAKKRRT